MEKKLHVSNGLEKKRPKEREHLDGNSGVVEASPVNIAPISAGLQPQPLGEVFGGQPDLLRRRRWPNSRSRRFPLRNAMAEPPGLRLRSQNVFSWAAIIGLHTRTGHCEEALLGYIEMQNHGFLPDNFVVPNIMKACGFLRWNQEEEKEGRRLLFLLREFEQGRKEEQDLKRNAPLLKTTIRSSPPQGCNHATPTQCITVTNTRFLVCIATHIAILGWSLSSLDLFEVDIFKGHQNWLEESTGR
ncbi:Pentatricopeptide repeat-containing protein [Vigna angularis]|uniref:Pentatricopeptide repeat-containing protein n=1 Tax=Phaseolus angularis TaxID=3914 RepID=A0A8T0LCY5_PHAAN|nr:Pentatricopeptide repeat-containing protein [Vigna angularis]